MDIQDLVNRLEAWQEAKARIHSSGAIDYLASQDEAWAEAKAALEAAYELASELADLASDLETEASSAAELLEALYDQAENDFMELDDVGFD